MSDRKTMALVLFMAFAFIAVPKFGYMFIRHMQ